MRCSNDSATESLEQTYACRTIYIYTYAHTPKLADGRITVFSQQITKKARIEHSVVEKDPITA